MIVLPDGSGARWPVMEIHLESGTLARRVRQVTVHQPEPDVKWLIYTAHYKGGSAREIDQGNYRIKRELSSIDFRRANVELGLTCGHVVT